MPEQDENQGLDPKARQAPKARGFSEEHLKKMADYLSKRRGRAVSEGEANESLSNLLRYFKWIRDHKKPLKGET